MQNPEGMTTENELTWPPTDLAASLDRYEDFRAIDVGGRHEIWEVHGRRGGEWFDLFDLDTGQAIAEFVRDALIAEKMRLGNADKT
jgi:hypothetical protein